MKRFWLAVLIVLSLAVSSYAADIRTGGGHQIQENSGTPFTQRPKINFTGTIDCADNAGNNSTDCEGLTVAVPAANYYVAGHMSPAEIINTLDDSVWSSSACKLGTVCVNLDGVNDYATVRDIDDVDPTTAWTLEAWIKKPINVLYYGELLLHMDDTGLTNSGTGSHTMTLVNQTARSTAQSKFGGYSAIFDGTTDSLTTPDSADFDFSGGIWTVDVQVRVTNLATPVGLFSQQTDANNYVWAYIHNAGNITLIVQSGGVQVVNATTATGLITTATWYHIEFVEDGDNYYIFINGVNQCSTGCTDTSRPANYTGALAIGSFSSTYTYAMNGHIDEFRTMKGVAYHTATFAAPTYAYPLEYGNFYFDIISKYDNTASKGGYTLSVDVNNFVTARHWSGTSYEVCTGTTAIATNTWQHVAATYSSSTDEIKCYLQGALENTGSATGVDYSTTVPLIIGANGNSPTSNFFNGYIDEVAIWNVALPASDAGAIDITNERYNGGTGAALVGNESGLEAVWHFNDGAGVLALQSNTTQTGIGNDSNDCLSDTTPCRTIQAAINKIPKFFAGSTIINIAAGIYPEKVLMRGFNPSGNYTVIVNGVINPTPNDFNMVSGVPTDVATITDTASATATTAFPTAARSLFTDTLTFTTAEDEQILRLTSGTGWKDDTAGYDYTNWYRIECAWGTSCTAGTKNNLSIATVWQPISGDGYATPVSGTGYKIYHEKYMAQIHGGGANRFGPSGSDGIRDMNLHIQDSAGIVIRKMRFTGSLNYNVKVTSSSVDEVSTSTFDYGGYAGLWFENSFVVNVIANKFAKTRNEGFLLFQNSAATIIGKNLSINNNGPGFAAYYSSSVLVMNTYLLKNNTQNNMDWETNSQCLLTKYIRSDSTDSGNSGIVINSDATLSTLGYLTVTGNANSTGLYIGGHSKMETFGLTSGSQVEILNHKTGIKTFLFGACDSNLTSGCMGFIFSGNTNNLAIGAGAFRGFISELDHSRYFYEYDDFISGTETSGSIGKLNWIITNDVAGTIDTNCNGQTDRPGCITIATSVTNPSYIMLTPKLKADATGLFDSAKDWEIIAIVKCVNAGTNICEFGMAYTFDMTKYVKFKSDISQTYWYAINSDGTTTPSTTTAVTRSTSAWYRLKIMSTGGVNVKYYINDVLVATHTTGLPTGQMQPYFYQYTSSGAVKNMIIDFFSLTMPSPER